MQAILHAALPFRKYPMKKGCTGDMAYASLAKNPESLLIPADLE